MSETIHPKTVTYTDPHYNGPTLGIAREWWTGIVSEEPDLSTVTGLLDDEYARTILAETSQEPLSASELADRCDASLATVTRRLNDLETASLITEQTRPRADGHHDTVYVAQLDRLEVRLRNGTFEFDVSRRDRDMTDELTRLWGRF